MLPNEFDVTGKIALITGAGRGTEGADALIERVLKRFGRIDVLVNNLGDAIPKPLVALPETSTTTIGDDDLARIFDLNAMATLASSTPLGSLRSVELGGCAKWVCSPCIWRRLPPTT